MIDLGKRLGLEKTAPDDRNVIIVVDIQGRTVGLRVDAVSDILVLPGEQIRPAPDMAADDGATFLRALTIVDDRMVRILDLTAVLPQAGEAAA